MADSTSEPAQTPPPAAPAGRVRRMTPRFGLVTKVGVLSAVAVILLGLVLAHTLSDIIRAEAMNSARQTTGVVADVGVQPWLTQEDLSEGLRADRLAQLDAIWRPSLDDGQVSRIKLWSPDGRVIYSDDLSEVGQQFPRTQELNTALDGTSASEVSDLSKSENVAERHFGRLLEVYVPIQFEGQLKPSGAFEIYRPYAPIAAAIDRDTRRVYLVLLVGLALLWLLLLRIVIGASRSLRRQGAENEHQALHDALTGLPNRTQFRQLAVRAMAAARRSGQPAAILILDLDRFKEINDTLGHHVGDQILVDLGARLQRVVPETGTVARLGGDEFAVLLADHATHTDAAAMVQKLEHAIRDPFTVAGLSLEVDASVGIVVFPDDGDDVDILMQRADVAMYLAKDARVLYEFYDPDRDRYSPDRLVLVGELRRAISEGELVLHYQPLIDLATGSVQSVEALVRWQHPQRGLLAPDEFLPLAEKTGLMWPLTRWVLDEALSQLAAWQGHTAVPRVSVNLSPRTLTHPGLIDELGTLLDRYALAPGSLELEITEDTVMADPGGAQAVLHLIREFGIELAIDDFGTGQSSLAYLQRLSVDWLKIDKSFVMNMASDVNDAAIVRASIELGHSLGLRIVAEGVETTDALSQLMAVGCDVAQGFHISRPVSPQALEAWLREGVTSGRVPSA